MALTTGTAALIAGGSVVAGLLGGLFSSKSQSSANETNLQAARETNQMNRELFNQSLAWQEDMWNKNNQYNSPAETIKRLQRAGINPALGSEFGQASMPSVPSAPSMQPGHVEPVDYSWVPQTINTGINAYFNNQVMSNQVTKSAADAQIAKADAEFQTQSLKYRLIETMNSAYKTKWEKEQARVAYNVLNQTQQEAITQSQWNTKIMAKTYDEAINKIAESKLRQDAMVIANKYAPKLSDAQLKSYYATISEAYAAAAAHNASALESAANAAVSKLQGEGIQIDNRTKRNMASSLITKAQEEAKQAKETTTSLAARNLYGEARQRTLGSYPIEIKEDKISKGAHKLKSAYQRGVERGLQKKKKELSW